MANSSPSPNRDAQTASGRLQRRAAALTRWSRIPDSAAALEPAREGFLRKFEKQVDPEGKFAPAVRHRMAVAARRAYMLELSRKGIAARAAKSNTQ